MYEHRYVYEILMKSGEDKVELGILVDEDMGESPYRAQLYGSDLLLKSDERKIKYLALNDEIQKLIRSGSKINLVNLKNNQVVPVDYVPSLNGA